MGLDLGFYTGDGTGVLEFRGHDGLLDRILAVTHDRIAPFSDFHVTRSMVTSLLAGIEADLRTSVRLCHLGRIPTSYLAKTCVAVFPRDFAMSPPRPGGRPCHITACS